MKYLSDIVEPSKQWSHFPDLKQNSNGMKQGGIESPLHFKAYDGF